MDTLYTLNKDELPYLLKQINDPPKKLFVKGKMPKEDTIMLCVVGARKNSSYGEQTCKKLIAGLKGYNICIVSGLALGIDGIAHRAAMEAGLQTIAFPGSGLDASVLYPSSHRKLADEILYTGGALLSEFEMMQEGTNWTFPKRNRLMAGISKATLIIEAELISGSLITSRLATEYNREVGVVPGQIFSRLSEGPNMLMRLGAVPITSSDDILEMLGLKTKKEIASQVNTKNNIQKSLLTDLNDNERSIINLLSIESNTSEELIKKSSLTNIEINKILSSLEIQGLIKSRGGRFEIQ